MSGVSPPAWDPDLPWNRGVRGGQVLPLINVDAPVIRVQAGPGTGKTFGLRKRVLRILHPKGLATSPAEVLVCTFNRAIAKDLASEIRQELEGTGIEMPTVSTIHSLAAGFAMDQPRFLLTHEAEAAVYDVLERNPILREKYPRHSKALRALREHEADLESHPALTQAIRGWLIDHHGSLVGDTPRKLEKGLESGDPPPREYKHVIVDEFQDLTDIEARLVLRLRASAASFVAVGDRKQSIYAFRGNAEKGLGGLEDLVSPESVFDLTMNECQRCSAQIVDVGNAVMALEAEPLLSVRPEPAELHLLHFKTPDAETKGMARHIARTFNAHKADNPTGSPRPSHLVLVTRRAWGYALRSAINSLDPDLAVHTVFGEDILETWPVREAFLFLSIVADPTDAINLRSWIGYRTVQDGRKFKAPKRNAEAYREIQNASGVLNASEALRLADLGPNEFSGAGKSIVLERLKRLKDLWTKENRDATAEEIVDSVFEPSRWVDAADPRVELASLDMERLRTEAQRLLKETPLTISKLVPALRYRIATREPLGEPDHADIKIVTLWGAKGLTSDYVYLMGLVQEALPGKYDEESTGLTRSEWLDEQRRLLYVSLTRAKKALVMSRPLKSRKGDIQSLNLEMPPGRSNWRELHLTEFLSDLPKGLLPGALDGTAWKGLS